MSDYRDGKWMHYRLNEPADKSASELLAATMKMLQADPQMKADRAKLMDVCCMITTPIKITR